VEKGCFLLEERLSFFLGMKLGNKQKIEDSRSFNIVLLANMELTHVSPFILYSHLAFRVLKII